LAAAVMMACGSASWAFSPPGECGDIGDHESIVYTEFEEGWEQRPDLFDLFDYGDGEAQLQRLWQLVKVEQVQPWLAWQQKVEGQVADYLGDLPAIYGLTTMELAALAEEAAYLSRFYDAHGEPEPADEYALVVDACFQAPDFRCDTGRWTGSDHYLVRCRLLQQFAIAFDLIRSHWFGPAGDVEYGRNILKHLFIAAQDFYIEGVCTTKWIDEQDNNWTVIPFSAIGTTMLAIAGTDCRDCDNGPWTCGHGVAVDYEKMYERARNEIQQSLTAQITRDADEDGAVGLLGWAEGPDYYSYTCQSFLPYQVAFETTAGAVNQIVSRDLPTASLIFDDARWAEDFYYTALFNVLEQQPDGFRPNVDDANPSAFYSAYLAGVYRAIAEGEHPAWLGARDYQGVPAYLLFDWDARRLAQSWTAGFPVECLLLFRDNRADYQRVTGGAPEAFTPPLRPALFAGHAGAGVLRSGWDADASYLYVVAEHDADFDPTPYSNHEQADGYALLARAHGEPMLVDGGYGAWECRDEVDSPLHHSLILAENIFFGCYEAVGAEHVELTHAMASGLFPEEGASAPLAWMRVEAPEFGDIGTERAQTRSIWQVGSRFWVVADHIEARQLFLDARVSQFFHGPGTDYTASDPLFNRGVWQSGDAALGIFSSVGNGARLLGLRSEELEHANEHGCDFETHTTSILDFDLFGSSDFDGMVWSLLWPMDDEALAPVDIVAYESDMLSGLHIFDLEEGHEIEYLIECRELPCETPHAEGIAVESDAHYALTKVGGQRELRHFMAADAEFYAFDGEERFRAPEGTPAQVYIDVASVETTYVYLQDWVEDAAYRVRVPYPVISLSAAEVTVTETVDLTQAIQFHSPADGWVEFSAAVQPAPKAYLALRFIHPELALVPEHYPSVQQALDQAFSGMEIEVAPGRYRETWIDFHGKAVTLRSRDPLDPEVVAATVIDGEGDGSVFHFHSGEGAGSVLAGFTITHGSGRGWPDDYGGGITMSDWAAPTIDHCTLSNNSALCGEPECDCISGLAALEPDYRGYGAALHLSESAAPEFNACVFAGNRADRGGVAYLSGAAPLFINCVFQGNRAGGVCADQGLGGVFYAVASDPLLLNCTLYDNWAQQSAGVLYASGGSCSIQNSILWGNGTDAVQAGGCDLQVIFSDAEERFAGEGNISADPRLSSDLHLTICSPCRNRASVELAPETDREGDLRGARADIGADEFARNLICGEKVRARPSY
jgi:hypothetical protein